jgi:hypothetical protein
MLIIATAAVHVTTRLIPPVPVGCISPTPFHIFRSCTVSLDDVSTALPSFAGSLACVACAARMFTFPVRVVFVHRRSSLESMSSRTPPVAESAEEDVSELGASGASVITPSTRRYVLDDIKSVWEFEKVEKLGGPDDFSKRWHCGWCGSTLKGWNATKAMNHLARLAGNNDVKSCSGPISRDMLELFKGFRLRKIGKKAAKRQKEEAYQNLVSENQKSMAVAWEDARVRMSASSLGAGTVIDMCGGDTDVAVSNSAKLTTAIADFVYCKGLPFSAAEGEQFLQILKLAHLVPSSYHPPSRHLLANDLLDFSYKTRIEKYLVDLAVDSDVYGLSLFGDGATVHGMPLMNILASGVAEPCAVLSVVDCKFQFGVCLLFFSFCAHKEMLLLSLFHRY